jgi:hypothetical protein
MTLIRRIKERHEDAAKPRDAKGRALSMREQLLRKITGRRRAGG